MTQTDDTETFTITMSREQFTALAKNAEKNNRTFVQELEKAILDYLDAMKKPAEPPVDSTEKIVAHLMEERDRIAKMEKKQ